QVGKGIEKQFPGIAIVLNAIISRAVGVDFDYAIRRNIRQSVDLVRHQSRAADNNVLLPFNGLSNELVGQRNLPLERGRVRVINREALLLEQNLVAIAFYDRDWKSRLFQIGRAHV